MRGSRRGIAMMIGLCLAVPAVSSAQFRGLGHINGTVSDESGTPLKDVSIRATMTGQEGVLEGRTDAKGWWAVNGLARGEWHLTFQVAGYAPVAAKVVLAAELAPDRPLTVVLKKASK